MTISGMRPDEVRAMAGQVRGQALRLRTIATQIDGRVARSSWVGPQATRFRNSAWPRHRAQLLTAAQGLEQLAANAERQAAEQERTSGSAGFSGGVPGGGAIHGQAGRNGSPSGMSPKEAWDVVTEPHNVLGLAGVLANTVSWRRYVNQVFYSPWTQQMPGLRNAVGTFAERAAGARIPHLEPNAVSRALNAEKFAPVMKALDHPAMTGAGKFVGVVSIAEDGLGAIKSAREGDGVGVALNLVDVGAGALKMSRFPPAYAAGVGIDAITDVIDYLPFRGKHRNTEKWNPLGVL